MLAHHYRELLGFLLRWVRDRDTAADLAQETFVRVLAAEAGGQAIDNPRALLFHTARNLVVDNHRRASLREHADIDSLAEAEHPLAPTHLQPEAVLERRQHARSVVAAIEALPPRCREAFVLNRFDGLSHAEVAARMGISRNMVAQHIVRAVLACKAHEDRLPSSAAAGKGSNNEPL